MKNNAEEKEIKKDAPSASLVHNVFIVWKPEYNLGIPIIDEQHRGIVTIINSLHYGAQSRYIKNILSPTIGMFRSYAVIHFQTEEFFLKTAEYPDAANHCLLHQEYTSKLAMIERECSIDKDPRQLMGFVKKWWLGHICEEDMLFRNFFV